MPRPTSKNLEALSEMYIPELLTEDELNEIRRILAIEKVWFGSWKNEPREKHWYLRGEDGFYVESVGSTGETRTKLAIDMRNHLYERVDGSMVPIGWVPAERIVPWQRGVVPTAINWFTTRYFGKALFHYGLYFYYQLQPFLLVVGGRGSGKTLQVALAAGAWISLHPGENWIHYAYTLEQAKILYQVLYSLGRERVGGISEKDAPLSWFETFVAPNGYRESPYPRIQLRKWDAADPGNQIDIRPLNPSSDAQQTRSNTCARCSIDECTTQIEDERVIAIAEATVRGPNEWRLAQLDPQERNKVQDLLLLSSELEREGWNDPENPNYERYLSIQQTIDEYGLGRHLGRIRTGNRGTASWIPRRQQMAAQQPEIQGFYVVPFTINPFLTRADREALLATYPDPEQAEVELYAREPLGMGTFFPISKLKRCESKVMNELVSPAKEGTYMNEWGGYVVEWRIPWEPGYTYVLGGDPGTGRVPDRDSWNVQVWRLPNDGPPAELCYFKWGNLVKISGSWKPFMESLEEARTEYRILPEDTIIGVGGQEKGILEATYGELLKGGASNFVTAVSTAAGNKMMLANFARELVGAAFLRWPSDIHALTMQCSNWEPQDDKGVPQDTVMALTSAAYRIYWYFSGFLNRASREEAAEKYASGGKHRRPVANRAVISRRRTLQ